MTLADCPRTPLELRTGDGRCALDGAAGAKRAGTADHHLRLRGFARDRAGPYITLIARWRQNLRTGTTITSEWSIPSTPSFLFCPRRDFDANGAHDVPACAYSNGSYALLTAGNNTLDGPTRAIATVLTDDGKPVQICDDRGRAHFFWTAEVRAR